jgi:alpha-1,2-mannosyltransferase
VPSQQAGRRRGRALAIALALNGVVGGLFLLSFNSGRPGLASHHIDLDVYRLAARVWLNGGDLYGPLPAGDAGLSLPFTYPPFAAVLLAPLTMVPALPASMIATLGSIALVGLVSVVVLRSFGVEPGRQFRLVLWILPVALLMDPFRQTLIDGQVNVLLMALVAVDTLPSRTRWPRGLLVGLAAAVKLTPLVFVVYFLVRRDRPAAKAAVVSFGVFTAIGFLAAPRSSLKYWTDIVFGVNRVGGVDYAANQSLRGVLARLGVDGAPGFLAWSVLSIAVFALAIFAMRSAVRARQDALAVAYCALAGLLVSPISWSHHWVWAPVAVLALAVAGRRMNERRPVVLATTGFVLLVASPHWWFPRMHHRELEWPMWQQILGSSYVAFALAVLFHGALDRPIRRATTCPVASKKS